MLAQKQGSEDQDKDDAELVNRRYSRGFPELEGAEIAHPRQTSCQPRQHKEGQRSAADMHQRRGWHIGQSDSPNQDKNNRRSNGGGQIRINIGDSLKQKDAAYPAFEHSGPSATAILSENEPFLLKRL